MTLKQTNNITKQLRVLSRKLTPYLTLSIAIAINLINSNLTKIQDKMNNFVMFPLEITQAGKKYEYIGNLSVKKLSKKGLIDISNFDLIIIGEIEGEQYQGFYKEIKETNE